MTLNDLTFLEVTHHDGGQRKRMSRVCIKSPRVSMSPDVTRALGVHRVNLGRPVAAAAAAIANCVLRTCGLGKSGLSGCRRRGL